MNELILYTVIAILGIISIYTVYKVRQPIILEGGRSLRKKGDDIPDLSDLGGILTELQPELERNLKLNEEQKGILDTWIKTIGKITSSKLMTWVLNKVSEL